MQIMILVSGYCVSHDTTKVSCHPPQVPIRGDGVEELVLDALVDFEFRVGLEGFPDGGFRVVTGGLGHGNISIGIAFIRIADPHHKTAADCA